MPLLPTEDIDTAPHHMTCWGVCPPFVVNSFEHQGQKNLGSFPYLGHGDPALFRSHSQGT